MGKLFSFLKPYTTTTLLIILLFISLVLNYKLFNLRKLGEDSLGQMQPVTIAGKPVSVIITETKLVYVTKEPGAKPVVIGLWPEDKVKISQTGALSVQRFGPCFKPGLGYALSDHVIGPAASIRILHFRRWGVSAAGYMDGKGAWAVGPVADMRFKFLRNVRVGIGFGLAGLSKPFMPSTVDLR